MLIFLQSPYKRSGIFRRILNLLSIYSIYNGGLHMGKTLQHILIALSLCFCMVAPLFAENIKQPQNENWKSKWYVNTIWYQIFPDRFFNGDKKNDPTKSELYELNGKLKSQPITPWNDEHPLYNSKYGGDLAGVMEKLGYISDLGVSGIWFNPIFKATSNHKYNCADYGAVDPEFGTRQELADLVKAAHQKNIKIILDGVFNHTGYEFWAFQDIVKKGDTSPYKDWYFVKSYPIVKLWEQTKDRGANYDCWWGFGSLPKLNVDNPNTRGYIIDTCKGWLKLGIDGWRLDVPEEIKSKDFWNVWASEMKKAKADVFMTGEIWGDGSAWLKGDRFNSLMNYYGFREPVLKFFAARKLTVSQFDKLLADRRALYPHSVNCALQNLLSSHDTVRILTAIQNGDETDSDKDKKQYILTPPTKEIIDRYKMAVLFQFTYVGAPMIYYGDEVGMIGGKDPDCRRPMIWDSSKQNGEILNFYKQLVSIRNEHPALRTGEFRKLIADDKQNIYAFSRTEGTDKLIVCINYSDKASTIKNKQLNGMKDLLTSFTLKKSGKIKMAPMTGMILVEAK